MDCKADTTWKTFRDTNMTKTYKAGSQQWTAVSLLFGAVPCSYLVPRFFLNLADIQVYRCL